jgi:hypothetical protein
MKRYGFYPQFDFCDPDCDPIDEKENGDYVLYYEAQAEIDSLKGELKASQDAFKIEWEEAERLTAIIKRYREALEKIRTDTGNRPGHETLTWSYYCERLFKLHLVADSALTEPREEK